MEWKPNKNNQEPIYRQVAKYFEELIIQGELSPGQLLPPERKLANLYGVNRSTITVAYEELRSTGLIQTTQGSGTRVSEQLWGVFPRRVPNWHQYTSRGAFIPTAPIIKKIRAVSQDPCIINLARGELSPDLYPTVTVERLLQNISPITPLGYADPQGELTLRQSLSAHLSTNYGISATANQILITSGAQQGLHLVTQCLLSPGDSIALEGPSYAYSLPLFSSAGLRLIRLPVDDKGLQPEEIPSLFRKHKIRMIFANPTYQNPTGTVLSLERRKRLLQICEELRIPIIEDNAYGAIGLENSVPPPTLIALNQGGGTVLHIGSLSKSAAPGFRIGWVVGPQSVVRRLADAKEQMDFGTSTITQQLANQYLTSDAWNDHVDWLLTVLKNRRDRMLRALELYLESFASWKVPIGGYHIWCKLKESVSEELLLEAATRNGVVFMPGGVFGAEKGFVRFTFARATEEDIEEGIHRTAKALNSLRK